MITYRVIFFPTNINGKKIIHILYVHFLLALVNALFNQRNKRKRRITVKLAIFHVLFCRILRI